MKKPSLLKKIKLPIFSLLFFILMFIAGLGKSMIQIFFLISFHELFHIAFALWYRYEIASIIIYPFGLGMYLEGMEYRHSLEEMIISMAGLFSFLFSTPILWLLLKVDIISSVNYNWMTMINRSILLFNALPIYPLDGGRILHGLVHIFFPYASAKKVTILTSFVVLGIFTVTKVQSISMLVIVLFFLCVQLTQSWFTMKNTLRQFYLYRFLHGCTYRFKKHSYQNLFRNYANIMKLDQKEVSEEQWLRHWMSRRTFANDYEKQSKLGKNRLLMRSKTTRENNPFY